MTKVLDNFHSPPGSYPTLESLMEKNNHNFYSINQLKIKTYHTFYRHVFYNANKQIVCPKDVAKFMIMQKFYQKFQKKYYEYPLKKLFKKKYIRILCLVFFI